MTITKVKDVYGNHHYVHSGDLANAERTMLRRHTSRGRPLLLEDEKRHGIIMLHRKNIACS